LKTPYIVVLVAAAHVAVPSAVGPAISVPFGRSMLPSGNRGLTEQDAAVMRPASLMCGWPENATIPRSRILRADWARGRSQPACRWRGRSVIFPGSDKLLHPGMPGIEHRCPRRVGRAVTRWAYVRDGRAPAICTFLCFRILEAEWRMPGARRDTSSHRGRARRRASTSGARRARPKMATAVVPLPARCDRCGRPP